MDTFKILARSSNLQKHPGHDTATKLNQSIPSEGNAIELRRGGERGVEPPELNQNLRGVKRKRKSKEDLPASETLREQKTSPKFDSNYPKDPSIIGGSVENAEPNDDEIFPEQRSAEYRKILKRNRLKLTLLYYSGQTQHTIESSEPKTQSSNARKEGPSSLFPRPLSHFADLRTRYKISKRLAENLDAQGYRNPTEVQVGSLPILLGSDEERCLTSDKSKKKKKSKGGKSHVDLLTIAPTGSGKTLAFLVNVIHRLMEERQSDQTSGSEHGIEHRVQALIVAPTHELADQIVNEGRKLTFGTGLKVAAMKKGLALHSNHLENQASHSDLETDEVAPDDETSGPQPFVKANILVSTPMLIVNTLSEGNSKTLKQLPSIRHLVLDEADVLLDPLFRPQTLSIWNACTNPSLQTTFWSATIGSSIESLAQSTILSRRRTLGITSPHYIIRVVVGLKDSAIPNITHRLTYAATEQGKLLALRQLLHPTAPSDEKGPSLRPPFLVFTQTIQRAVALHSELLYDIPPEAGGSSRIAVLHSDLSDSVRSNIMAGFRKGEIWILITTDLLPEA